MTQTVYAADRREDIVESVRPWGRFEQFTLNEPATVKIITVEPGQRLSLQRHRCRSEMWQVLDGPLDVEVDGQRWSARTGERVWIPQGSTHRLGNSELQRGRVLEVALGDFNEDDIERLEDDYRR